MTEVSTFRLNLLRSTYLLIFLGQGSIQLPAIVHHSTTMWHGVGSSMLTATSLLVLFGIRYPLQMLPMLLYELLWKSTWLIVFALPLWMAHRIDPATAESVAACLLGWVIFPIVIPWSYVIDNYVKKPGDRWTRPTGSKTKSPLGAESASSSRTS